MLGKHSTKQSFIPSPFNTDSSEPVSPRTREQAGCRIEPRPSPGQLQANSLVHIAHGPHCSRLESANGMCSRCALAHGTQEGGFVSSKLTSTNVASLFLLLVFTRALHQAGGGASGVPYRKTIAPSSTSLRGSGQGNLARSLSEIVEALGSQETGSWREEGQEGQSRGRNRYQGHS